MSNHTCPRILVVEDDLLIRMQSADLLAGAGYDVTEAGNADEAMSVLESAEPIELVFSDIDMPGSMDGMSLARLVYRRWPGIRLLLTSGHHGLTDDDVPDHGTFLPKPYSDEVMIYNIRTLLTDV